MAKIEDVYLGSLSFASAVSRVIHQCCDNDKQCVYIERDFRIKKKSYTGFKIKATRKFRFGKTVDIVLTIGKPNYREKQVLNRSVRKLRINILKDIDIFYVLQIVEFKKK